MRGLGICAVLCLVAAAHGCTMILVGHNATKDGSGFAIHTDDAGFGASDMRVVRVPARNNPAGSKRPVYYYRNGYPRGAQPIPLDPVALCQVTCLPLTSAANAVVTTKRAPAYAPKSDQTESVPLTYIDEVPHTYAYLDQGMHARSAHAARSRARLEAGLQITG